MIRMISISQSLNDVLIVGIQCGKPLKEVVGSEGGFLYTLVYSGQGTAV